MADRKAQVISVDLSIAIVLFLIGFVAFYFLFFSEMRKDIRPIAEENALLSAALQTSPGMKIIDRGQVSNPADIERWLTMSDDELKATLGLRHDFCVILTNSEGELRSVELSDGCYAVAFGTRSVKYLINGVAVPCGTTFTADGCRCGQVMQGGACVQA